jgi:amylosucrase
MNARDTAPPDSGRIAVAKEAFLGALPASRRSASARAFEQLGGALIDQLESLYGDTPEFPRWLPALFRMLGDMAAARPLALQVVDDRRANQPDWFVRQRMLGYSAYVDRFGGTLAGVGERIDHLRALGVDYLHLLPFLRARAGDSDGGFAVASFDEVEPALGTMDELERLATQLRETGISLCSDLVLNHVADDHAWASAAKAGDPAMRAFFHVFPDRRLPDAWEPLLGQVFPQDAPGNFTEVPAMGGWVWTTFYPFQWDLNYAHPPVFAAIARALLQLANRGVEVFRLDSAPFLWKRPGSACINEPEVHQILAALRACTRLVAPGVLLKAEAIMPMPQTVAYFGQRNLHGRECHLAYHGSLMAAAWAALAEGSAALPRRLLAQTPANPPATGWVTYVRSHDDIVWNVLKPLVEADGGDFNTRIGAAAAFLEGRVPGSFARGSAFQTGGDPTALHGSNGMTASLVGLPDDPRATPDIEALRRFSLLHALALWVGAVPLLYMGDELGQANHRQTDTQTGDGRMLQRPKLSETAMSLLADPRSTPAATFAVLQALVRARRDPRWPATAAVEVVADTADALLVLRRGDAAVALFNFSGQPLALDPAGPGTDAGGSDLFVDGVTDEADGRRTMQPWSTLWRVNDHG